MKLEFFEKLDDGAFADVYRAKDQLGREVAVKIVRAAADTVSDALAHAKALARAAHPNVVRVFSIERAPAPESGLEVDCVVMELLRGKTLDEFLKDGSLQSEFARIIGCGIIDGLAHIHLQRLVHGDLHERNVMIVNRSAIIIDILYRSSLSMVSSQVRDSKVKEDLRSLRLLLHGIIAKSDLAPAEASVFNTLLVQDPTIDEIRAAFDGVFVQSSEQHESRELEYAFAQLRKEDFVEGSDYARALMRETSAVVFRALLERLITTNSYDTIHQYYVRLLWDRLITKERNSILDILSRTVETEIPRGIWWPSLRIIFLLAPATWEGLRTTVQMKLENLIVRDVLAGRKNVYGTKALDSGQLGTYARTLWVYFDKPEVFADNLISLLKQDWYTQNYVGEFFFSQIPAVAKATDRRSVFVDAIRAAVQNKSQTVVNRLDQLPLDWAQEVRAERRSSLDL